MEEVLADIDGTTRRFTLADKQHIIICYKGSNALSPSLLIDVSDGEKVWSCKLNADGLAGLQKKLKIASQAGVLSIMKNSLERRTCELQSSSEDEGLRVRFGAAILLPLTLSANPSAHLAFLDRLAAANEQWQIRLAEARTSVTELRQQLAAGLGRGDAGIGARKAAAGGKGKPTRTGMSVINPSSRKRKAAKGVVFEEDEDD